MSKMPWGSWDTVGDQSDYVNQFSTYISQTVPLYNDWLSPIHSRFFCDSFAGEFVPMLVKHIYSCKQISEIGAEQLLLDIAAMKAIIVDMPALTNARGGTSKAVPARYSKSVVKDIAKAEKILKIILQDPATLVATFVAVLPKGTEQLFIKLLNIKVSLFDLIIIQLLLINYYFREFLGVNINNFYKIFARKKNKAKNTK